MLASEVKDSDEEILKHLKKLRMNKQRNDKEEVWTFEFEFTENEYFEDTLLKQTIHIEPEGEKAVKSQATEINWKEGKDVTKKSVKK